MFKKPGPHHFQILLRAKRPRVGALHIRGMVDDRQWLETSGEHYLRVFGPIRAKTRRGIFVNTRWGFCMPYEAKINFLRRTGTMTATLALLAGGCLLISGVTADHAASESSNVAEKNGKWAGATSSNAAQKQGKAAQPAPSSSNAVQYQEKYGEQKTSITGDADTPRNNEDGESSAAVSNKVDKSDKLASLFRSDPQYDSGYNAKGNIDIYGAKTAVEPPRPLELGRQQYTSGAYEQSSTILGELNPLLPGLAVYGDWRSAVAYNQNNGKDVAQIATRLNIDVDLKITGTERIHAFFTPIQDNNKFSRFEFGGGDGDDKFTGEIDLNPQTLFLEGDAGALWGGFSGKENTFDLPFTAGLFPLFLQNGIWANDAILGGAVSLTAKNSRALGLANYDVTFFAAFDNVDNLGILGNGNIDNNANNNANLYGVTTFIDAFDGYIEAGYGLIQGTDDRVDGQFTNFLTASYSRRFQNTLSNSTRVFANFGDGEDDDGFAIISENSFITHLPSTLLPYANFFIGFENPQPLVDGNGAGILKNVGINFETDALTGYPKLNDTGSNAFGGALGLQYLFNLDQQIVFEIATVQPFGDVVPGIGIADPQYAAGVRYQIPINKAWLFRADATYQVTEGSQDDSFGLRTEVRRKF